jgi:hypothetical protein
LLDARAILHNASPRSGSEDLVVLLLLIGAHPSMARINSLARFATARSTACACANHIPIF